MEALLDISKGLHQDFKAIDQPAGTYRNLINGNRQLNGTITNERGTIRLATTAKRIVGSYVLDKDVILVLYPSEIGVLNSLDQYNVITNNVALNIQEPDLPNNYIVDITARKNFKGERIIYLADGFNPDRAINIDDVAVLASSNFGDITQLQLNPVLPNIVIDSITDQGSLPTGVYQFGIRLLTSSTNPTIFSHLTPLIPVIDGNNAEPFESQDGAPPQTTSSKAINLTITNIDVTYSFIEIVAITYIGTANVANANIIARLPIDNKNAITFTYSGILQNKEPVSLEELAVVSVSYTSSKSIEQKDNILIRSSLVAEDTSFNFQSIANAIKLKYFIEEIPWQFAYKDAITAALKRSYRRDEVYSFGITPNYKSASSNIVYHIPAPVGRSVNVFLNWLGTYESQITYPVGKGYPTNLSPYIRHHKMPTIDQEPIFVNVGGQIFIRILGIQVDMSDAYSLLSPDILKKLTGFNLVRQKRTENDKSILAQGLALPHYRDREGSQEDKDMARIQVAGSQLYGNVGYIPKTNPVGSEVGFFSPETIMYKININGNIKLVPVSKLTGTQTVLASNLPKADNNYSTHNLFVDYTNRASPDTITPININSNSPEYIPEFSNSAGGRYPSVNDPGLFINNRGSNGYLYFKLQGGFLPQNQTPYSSNSPYTVNSIPEYYYSLRSTGSFLTYLNGDPNSSTGTSEKHLFNISRTLLNQYGSIYDATYQLISKIPLSSGISNHFGGDTYIGKFAFIAKTSIYSGIIANADATHIHNFNCFYYYFTESEININFRHYNTPIGIEGDSNFVPGTVPYFPKSQFLVGNGNTSFGLFDLASQLGHARGYNKQYSFESNIIKYFPKQLAEEIVTSFENRSIYSEQGVEGEQLDSFRIFLPNNYHDIPKNRGPIINTFVHNNTFFIHTTGAIYKTAFNERAILTSSAGEAVLGNGGVFSRPSEPVLTIDGGYGGIQTKHGLSTPFGYFFFDGTQKKFFQYTDQLTDISEQGMKKFFGSLEDNLKINLAFDYEYNRLLIGNFKTIPVVTGWTLSFHALLKSWSSYHSYIPHYMFSRGKDLYLATTVAIYKHNVGIYGSYLDNNISNNTVATEIDLVFNDAPDQTKIFDNLVLYTTSVLSTEVDGINRQNDTAKQLHRTFTTFQGFNETKNTGEVNLIVPKTFDDEFASLGVNDCFAKLKNDEFRIAIPCDLVINTAGDVLDDANLHTDRAYKPRMSGKWMIARFKYNNSLILNSKLSLHSIKKIFRNKTNGRENIR